MPGDAGNAFDAALASLVRRFATCEGPGWRLAGEVFLECMPIMKARVVVSVVSHRHGACLTSLLSDLALPGNAEFVRVILTLNIPEELPHTAESWPYEMRVVRNAAPRGFAANHNQAFQAAQRLDLEFTLFCVLNPDVRMPAGTMAALLRCFDASPGISLLAPAVITPAGEIEDSLRPLPSPLSIAWKGLRLLAGLYRRPEGVPDHWDWLAGMCMLFDARAFAAVGGFDERYFLYYEDVDICCRIRLDGGRLSYCPEVRIVHDARRDSHRRLAYLARHVLSAARFFFSPTYRRCRRLPPAGSPHAVQQDAE